MLFDSGLENFDTNVSRSQVSFEESHATQTARCTLHAPFRDAGHAQTKRL